MAVLSAAALLGAAACAGSADPDAYLYENLPFEMTRVPRPAIPALRASITDFGAVSDAVTLNTEAFEKTIAHLSQRGGGVVEVPAGVWYTGPIVLRDNIELNLAQGSVIVFSGNSKDYPLINTVFEGLDTRRCQSPVSAEGAKNIAITGQGIIDGSGDSWRAVKRDKMTASQWNKLLSRGGVLSDDGRIWYPSEGFKKGTAISPMNVPVGLTTDEQWEEIRDFLRPVMISLRNCENVLLEGVTFQNSPSWNIHPFMCTNLRVHGITVRNPWYSQNGDGIDIESCTNVVLTDSSFDAGDDGICIKSGKDEDGRRRGAPCQNIIVDNCTVFHGHGGFVVGSEMSGGVKNVSVTNCRFSGTDVGLRFKSTRGRGGVVENIHISDIAMNDIANEPLLFDLFYGGKSASEALEAGEDAEASDLAPKPVDETTPQFRDIFIRNVWCRGARRAMLFNGLPEMNVENVRVENCAVYAQLGAQINESRDVVLRNVSVYPQQGPALMINNAKQVVVEGFSFECAPGQTVALSVTGSRNEAITVDAEGISADNSQLSLRSQGKVTFK